MKRLHLIMGFLFCWVVSLYFVSYYIEMRDLSSMALPMPKGLDEHYERIRRYESSRFVKYGDEGYLLFYASQVLHDLGEYRFNEYAEFNRTFGVECRNLTVSFAENCLALIEKFYPSYGRVEQIYNWVNYFVQYVNDTDGYPRFPVETLVYRFGDCEDQAMALSFLLEISGYETALCLIHDRNLTRYGPEGLYHVFCALRKTSFEYNGALIKLYRYPEYGKSWIILDPACNHPYGSEPEWTENYRLENGTITIPDEVWISIVIDEKELTKRMMEMGIKT